MLYLAHIYVDIFFIQTTRSQRKFWENFWQNPPHCLPPAAHVTCKQEQHSVCIVGKVDVYFQLMEELEEGQSGIFIVN